LVLHRKSRKPDAKLIGMDAISSAAPKLPLLDDTGHPSVSSMKSRAVTCYTRETYLGRAVSIFQIKEGEEA
jgi:hypothetical protein